MPISGTALAVAAAGGIVAYAGFRGVSPLEALRSISTGQPMPVASQSEPINPSGASIFGGIGQTIAGAGLRAQVVSATSRYLGDKYSQLRRTQPGYSDCSSFVDKALKSAGIMPPGGSWANTTNFIAAKDWTTIPMSETHPGDIGVAVGHMVLVTGSGGASAIGQENSRVNVRTGPARSLFSTAELATLRFRTYNGYATAATPPSGGTPVRAE